MKSIIDGRVYDTCTATAIGSRRNMDDAGDQYYCAETLYRKRTGEYFLLGEGGPGTKYAEKTGKTSWSSGARIMPVTYVEAREWAMDGIDSTVFDREFGEISDDNSTEIVTISLPASAATKLRRAAQEKGISLSALIASFSNLEVK